MALPKIDLPRYEVKLPGINKKVKFRPFTVKEQKILLSAKADEKPEGYVEAIKQIIDLCTFGKLDSNTLPICDIETLFIKIRAKSVEEVIRIPYSYKYEDEDGKEQKDKITVEINLDELEVDTPEDHDKRIMVGDDLGIMMKYPGIDMMSNENTDDMQFIRSCVDYIFNSEEVFRLEDETEEEINEFFDSLDTHTLEKINKFFMTMPRVRYSTTVKLKDGTTETINYEGISDFFS